MTQRDMAGYLNIDVKTLRNWRNNKPNLYKIIIKGLTFEDVVKQAETNYVKLKEISENLQK